MSNDDDDNTIEFKRPVKPPILKVVENTPVFDYKKMVNVATLKAYYSILHEVFSTMAITPVPDMFNISVTFDMRHPDITAPMATMVEYPELITIILNQRYTGLQVFDDYFEVTVYFNGKPVNLLIPFAAITVFRDEHHDITIGFGDARMDDVEEVSKTVKEALDEMAKEDDTPAKIVSLDAFRNKGDKE